MNIKSVTLPFSPLLLVLLAACGGNQPTGAASSATQQTAQAAAPAAPAGDDALAPLFGDWALDLAQCTGGQTLQISKVRFEGPGSGCDITGFTDNGDGTYTAAMSCTANGKTATEKIQMRPIFAPTGEGIDLVYLNRDNLQSTVLRCPATASK
jgi:hypothetical protein